jgi:NAD(P)-dependent dehydrogenase (short-subunit alcohol dehydrogenase family)
MSVCAAPSGAGTSKGLSNPSRGGPVTISSFELEPGHSTPRRPVFGTPRVLLEGLVSTAYTRSVEERLSGKVALITGGARGQGASHGELFAEEGAKVVLGDVLDEAGERHAAGLRARGFDVLYDRLDVASDGDWRAGVGLAEREFGRLDILVNNAGIVGTTCGVVDETIDGWQQILTVNQTGVFLGMKHAIPAMRRAGGGSIVNTSSIWGVAGTKAYIGYQATKAAVRLMTKSAALTHACDNIRVNTVCPGLVMTPMLEDEPEESIAAVIAATPLRRGAQPREISYGVLFLASDEASYVTGTELTIDGGFLAQ